MGMMEPSPPYLLSRHAHLCVAGGVVVLLDVATGTYLSIGKQQAATLGRHVLGWPMQAADPAIPPILQTLLDRGLITRDPRQGKPAMTPALALPGRWMREGEPRGRPRITPRDLRRFAVAVAVAAIGKKCAPLSVIVARARRRAARRPAQPPAVHQLASLVRIFDWLRPLAFKKTDECFLYCFALSEFLASYGFFPSWVFAVRTAPFAAHCWLQHDDYVLTDIPFNLRRMVPILVL
ncbi:lasso peptide biosynthesis B2 protein [Xanthomonas melonis]|uniref:lasso peptide biosynthesis B2 protein n=1 Tax=Xanthomonas melonis TaxID=56456 RepID=UPI003EC09BCE